MSTQQGTDSLKNMLTVKELCEKYPYLSPSLVYLWIEQRELPHYRLGGRGRRGRIVIDEADFTSFVTNRRVEADNLPTDVDLPHLR